MKDRREVLSIYSAFFVLICLAIFPGLEAGTIPAGLPHTLFVPLSAPCPTHSITNVCSELWYPSGPSMDHLQFNIFTDDIAENTALQAGTIDLSDAPLSPALANSLPSSFYLTQQVVRHGDVDLQFMLANNFWGCSMNFGNSACGIDIRQGIAHLMDRSSFTINEGHLAGTGDIPKDCAVAAQDNGGLPCANPCAWDPLFVEVTDATHTCIVGAPGGTAYHIAAATGGAHGQQPWMPYFGDPDFCAAAFHFIHAGLATSAVGIPAGATSDTACIGNTTNGGVLQTLAASVTTNTVNFFARNDKEMIAAPQLGQSFALEICALFTGSFSISNPVSNGCGVNATTDNILTYTLGPRTAFPGFHTSETSVRLNWWIYTGSSEEEYPFDASLYFTYNSAFVSGIPAIQPASGPCSATSLPSPEAENYIYNCETLYDGISTSIEYANCLNAANGPTAGMAAPSFSNCSGAVVGTGAGSTNCSSLSTGCTMVSAAYQAEDLFGAHAKTIPIFTQVLQFGYPTNWQRVINSEGAGVPNYFTWLDAYSPNPAVVGTIRQGLTTSTGSISPYHAQTSPDFYVLNSIMDSLMMENPLNNNQLFCWMCVIMPPQLPNTSLTYLPPPGTIATYRFTLRSDMFWQDGRAVTAFDIAFSYLTLKSVNAYQASGLQPLAGVTVLSPRQFDLNLNAIGPTTLLFLTATTPALDPGPTMFPGRYWSNTGSAAWDSAAAACTGAGSAACYPVQYTLGAKTFPVPCGGVGQPVCIPTVNCALAGCGSFSPANMNPDPAKYAETYDPLAAGTLIGSGPWECVTSTGVVGTGCSSTGSQNPPAGGSYTLTRFGFGQAPASTLTGVYFRSNGNYALYIWTGMTGVFTQDFIQFTTVAAFFNAGPCAAGQPFPGTGTISSPQYSNCHYNWGIGAPSPEPSRIGIIQVSEVARFVGVDWTDPIRYPGDGLTGMYWSSNVNPPTLFEGTTTLAPAASIGCPLAPPIGYDC